VRGERKKSISYVARKREPRREEGFVNAENQLHDIEMQGGGFEENGTYAGGK